MHSRKEGLILDEGWSRESGDKREWRTGNSVGHKATLNSLLWGLELSEGPVSLRSCPGHALWPSPS